jgi:hypothetical protein
MAERTCTVCKETKPLSEFHKDPRGKFGTRARCKACETESVRKWRAENREHFLSSQKEYREANKGHAKEYREKNKERDSVTQRNWRTKNKEHKKQVHLKWLAANKDRKIAYIKEWHKKNPDRKRHYSKRYDSLNRATRNNALAKRRSMQKDACPAWLTAIQKAQIREFYDIAIARSFQTGIQYHVDHIHPLQGENFRGLHVPWNLQIITANENLAKCNKLMEAA